MYFVLVETLKGLQKRIGTGKSWVTNLISGPAVEILFGIFSSYYEISLFLLVFR